jgi:hypothetical protein
MQSNADPNETNHSSKAQPASENAGVSQSASSSQSRQSSLLGESSGFSSISVPELTLPKGGGGQIL